MEGIRPRKASVLKKRPSLAFFNSQKPTFTFSGDTPSRYFDFIDTPSHHHPPSPLIDRQKIDPALESEIRFSCSLLIYRIERGVPSTEQAPSERNSPQKDDSPAALPQINSKYYTPQAGPDLAALKDNRYDSGVALTAQPSRQTMRILQSSHSDRPSEPDTVRPGSSSIFSQRRCTTAGSATTYASQHSLGGARPPTEIQSVTGAPAPGQSSPAHKKGTRAFLCGPDPKPQTSTPNTDDDNTDLSDSDVEVFLGSDAAFMSTDTVPSFLSTPPTSWSTTSPSFALPDGGYVSSRQSKLYDGEPLERMGGVGHSDAAESSRGGLAHEPGVIVDSRGFMHIMTAEEESRRETSLREAVMARMGASSRPVSRIAPPPTAVCADSARLRRPRSNASRLPSSWSARTRATLAGLGRGEEEQKPGFFQRVKSFFGRLTKRARARD
ncbi:hypothetical protein HFD88_010358 [Aspergillus terreus]|nr:hypothetical protein HFD88_010358 [Aspergillus terreus]